MAAVPVAPGLRISLATVNAKSCGKYCLYPSAMRFYNTSWGTRRRANRDTLHSDMAVHVAAPSWRLSLSVLLALGAARRMDAIGDVKEIRRVPLPLDRRELVVVRPIQLGRRPPEREVVISVRVRVQQALVLVNVLAQGVRGLHGVAAEVVEHVLARELDRPQVEGTIGGMVLEEAVQYRRDLLVPIPMEETASGADVGNAKVAGVAFAGPLQSRGVAVPRWRDRRAPASAAPGRGAELPPHVLGLQNRRGPIQAQLLALRPRQHVLQPRQLGDGRRIGALDQGQVLLGDVSRGRQLQHPRAIQMRKDEIEAEDALPRLGVARRRLERCQQLLK
mmetsp:Transcript_46980/g.142646  ORF Transcript_46980/g.142646 Transcript_46980/m.142646 type:complete len:334 (+) Transcript_46980:138-1139(+)